jgi:dihydropteroate synthase
MNQAERRPLIVGVLNITPDSFSDGGHYSDCTAALSQIDRLLQEGADIVEIGAESTRPGSVPLTSAEERLRLEPLLQLVKAPERICIDTYHSESVALGLSYGVRRFNDVSSFRADPHYARVIGASGATVTIMYNKEHGLPHATERVCDYDDVIAHIISFFNERISFAESQGISRDQLILDSGMGKFLSHDPRYSWEVLARYRELSVLNLPLLIGTSRKGFLAPELSPVERDPLSQLTALHAYTQGAALIRTHNVAMLRGFVEVWGRLEPK